MKESEKVEIKRIVIRIKDKEIPLTPDEAKELHKVLGDMFGAVTTQWLPITVPYYPPYNPWPWHYDRWYVTYGSGAADNGVVYCSVT